MQRASIYFASHIVGDANKTTIIDSIVPPYLFLVRAEISYVFSMNLSEKRKALELPETLRNKPTKQPRLDAFFLPARAAGITTAQASPRHPPSSAKKKIPSLTTPKVESGPRLSDEQKNVLRMVVEEGRSVFFTGSAGLSLHSCHPGNFGRLPRFTEFDWEEIGTGKSLLLRSIIETLRKKYAKKPECLAVCASTGIAAQNIGGMC